MLKKRRQMPGVSFKLQACSESPIFPALSSTKLELEERELRLHQCQVIGRIKAFPIQQISTEKPQWRALLLSEKKKGLSFPTIEDSVQNATRTREQSAPRIVIAISFDGTIPLASFLSSDNDLRVRLLKWNCFSSCSQAKALTQSLVPPWRLFFFYLNRM